MLKNISKFGLLVALMATLCVAQQSSIQKEGNNWTSLASGSLSGVHKLHIKVETGAVKVQGGSTTGINYVIRNKSARRYRVDRRRVGERQSAQVFFRSHGQRPS